MYALNLRTYPMKKQANSSKYNMTKKKTSQNRNAPVKESSDDFKNYVEEITPLLFKSGSKSCTEYTMDPESHILFPGPQQWKERLIHALYKESNNPNMLHVNTFCRKYGFYMERLKEWVAREPELVPVYNHFKLSIAENRRVGAMRFKLNYNAIKGGLEKLDPEEKESFEYHNNLKGDALSKAGATTYVFQSANLPDPIVLPKPEDPHDISD